MIVEAIYDLLSTLIPVTDLIEDRVYPVAFEQTGTLPAITYNTRSMTPVSCRKSDGKTKEGLLEIGVLASGTLELVTLSETISDNLIGYAGTHAGYYLQIESSDEDFDESAEDINAMFKRLQFELTTTKL